MKNLFLLLLASFFTTTVFSNSLSPNENASVYRHLVEVNKLWKDIDYKSAVDHPISFETDIDRIQFHLISVEKMLRQKQLTDLTKNQIEKRHHHLDVLVNYFSAKQFPVNSYHDVRQPYFIDKFGTACAVGYLLLQDGQNEFIDKVVADNNYAYVMDMNYPVLENWATKNGFTKEELALIQPSYPPQPIGVDPVGNNLGVNGKINKLLTSPDGELMYMCGNFDTVDGNENYNSITAWNGEEWLPLGNGVNGEILDMDFDDNGSLIVVGNFNDFSDEDFKNIAAWNGSAWTFIQQGDMDGSIHVIKNTIDGMLIGGDFIMYNSEPMNHLARITADASWDNFDGALTVNGPVFSIEEVDGSIIVGGDFTETYPTGMDPNINQLQVKNLAYWDDNWVSGFEEDEIGVITSIDYINEKLYVGGPVDDGSYYSFLENGNWTHILQGDFLYMDSLGTHFEISGTIEYEDDILMYGGFTVGSGLTWGAGLISLEFSEPNVIGDFKEGGVYASAIYDDKLYFAGGFNTYGGGWTSNGVSANNLLSTNLLPPPPTAVSALEVSNVKIYYANEALNLEYDSLEENATLVIYDLNGQKILEVLLAAQSTTSIIDVSHFPKGAYAVSFQNDVGVKSEIVAVY